MVTEGRSKEGGQVGWKHRAQSEEENLSVGLQIRSGYLECD